MKPWIIVLLVVAAVLIVILWWPVHVSCGKNGYSCVTAPDENGVAHSTYDVQPLFSVWIEDIVGTDLPLKYYEGAN
jgi:hypothetical protein